MVVCIIAVEFVVFRINVPEPDLFTAVLFAIDVETGPLKLSVVPSGTDQCWVCMKSTGRLNEYVLASSPATHEIPSFIIEIDALFTFLSKETS